MAATGVVANPSAFGSTRRNYALYGLHDEIRAVEVNHVAASLCLDQGACGGQGG